MNRRSIFGVIAGAFAGILGMRRVVSDASDSDLDRSLHTTLDRVGAAAVPNSYPPGSPVGIWYYRGAPGDTYLTLVVAATKDLARHVGCPWRMTMLYVREFDGRIEIAVLPEALPGYCLQLVRPYEQIFEGNPCEHRRIDDDQWHSGELPKPFMTWGKFRPTASHFFENIDQWQKA